MKNDVSAPVNSLFTAGSYNPVILHVFSRDSSEKRGRITNNYLKSSEVNWSCNISGGVLFISYPRSHAFDVETEHLFHLDKSSNQKHQTPRTTYCLRDGKHLYGILIWLPINKIMSPTHATYYLHLRRAWLLQLSLIYKIQIFYNLNPQHNAFLNKSRIDRLANFFDQIFQLLATRSDKFCEVLLRGQYDELSRWNHFDISTWSQVSSAICYYVLIHVCKISTKIHPSKEPMDERWQHFLFEQYSVHCVTSDSINTNSTRCHEMERNAMKLSCPCQIVSIFDETFMCFKKINAYSTGLFRE